MLKMLFWSLCLSVFIPCHPVFAQNSERTSRGFRYTLENNKATITGYSDSINEKLEIPARIDGNPVQKIGKRAFYKRNDLRELIIQRGVKEIGAEAFTSCEWLETVSLPDGLETLERDAFYKCYHLKKVTLPEGLLKIEQKVFAECEKLNDIALPKTLIRIDQLAFEKCKAITTITIPKSIKGLGIEVFKECDSLTTVSFSETLDTIPKGFFYRCYGLKKIYLPEGLVTIGQAAFSDCKFLEAVTLPNSLALIDQWAFSGCENLPKITIPKNVKKIGSQAFERCFRLKEIIFLGDAPQCSDSKTFQDVTNATVYYRPLTKGWSPDRNGNWAQFGFPLKPLQGVAGNTAEKPSASTVDMGEIRLGEWTANYNQARARARAERLLLLLAFTASDWNGECIQMEEEVFATDAWKNHSRERYIQVKVDFPSDKSLLSRDQQLRNDRLKTALAPDCRYPTYLVIDPLSQRVLNGALKKMEKITPQNFIAVLEDSITVDFPGNADEKTDNPEKADTLTSGIYTYQIIDGSAVLLKCKETASGAVSVAAKLGGFPVTFVEKEAFKGCRGLTELILPPSLEKIGERAFSDCTGLRKITLPESLKVIETCAFFNCRELTECRMPDGIEVFGDGIFSGCDKLGTILSFDQTRLIHVQPSSVGEYAIPQSVVAIGGGAFFKCTRLTAIRLPSSLKEIGSLAFYDCRALRMLIIPETVITIGNGAFSQCVSLKRVQFRGNQPDCGENLFSGVSGCEVLCSPQKEGWSRDVKGLWRGQNARLVFE